MRHGHDATARPTGLAAIAAHIGIIGAHTGIIGAPCGIIDAPSGISGAYVRRPMLVAFVMAVVLCAWHGVCECGVGLVGDPVGIFSDEPGGRTQR